MLLRRVIAQQQIAGRLEVAAQFAGVRGFTYPAVIASGRCELVIAVECVFLPGAEIAIDQSEAAQGIARQVFDGVFIDQVQAQRANTRAGLDRDGARRAGAADARDGSAGQTGCRQTEVCRGPACDWLAEFDQEAQAGGRAWVGVDAGDGVYLRRAGVVFE